MVRQAILLGGESVLGRGAEALPVLDETPAVHLMRRLTAQGVRRILLAGCAEEVAGAEVECCARAILPERVAQWRGDVLVARANCLTDVDLRGLCTIGGESVALLHETAHPGDLLAVRDGFGRISGTRREGGGPAFTGMTVVRAERLAQMGEEALSPVGMRSRMIGGYCRTVRSLGDYAHVQQALLEGWVKIPVAGRRCGMAIIGDGAEIAPRVRITGRCFIGSGAVIHSGAEIGEGAVISAGVTVGRGARVEMSCLWRGTDVPPGRTVRNLLVVPHRGNASLRQILTYTPFLTT